MRQGWIPIKTTSGRQWLKGHSQNWAIIGGIRSLSDQVHKLASLLLRRFLNANLLAYILLAFGAVVE